MKSCEKKKMSRRKFLANSALAGFAFHYVPSGLLGADAPSNKLNIAGIGIGGMGGSNLKQCSGENIVALCDVDSDYAAKTIKRYPKAKLYKDYRVM
ncbi:MAG: gfo/Idh/MocA family oxidoreductase, partial [Planctomycetota bacterium]